jgi:hypothetical protein
MSLRETDRQRLKRLAKKSPECALAVDWLARKAVRLAQQRLRGDNTPALAVGTIWRDRAEFTMRLKASKMSELQFTARLFSGSFGCVSTLVSAQ